MPTLPPEVSAYKRTSVFSETTVPSGLLNDHRTAPGVWGVINVIAGELRYEIPSLGESRVLTPERPGIVEPGVTHSVQPLGAARFFVEFYR